ncbi:RNA 2',3'-cyclic phosphodiesterase [Streptomyces sp. HNM0574]|nr:RNA 2',3'-cyclic phosphodiesterase [Streptomyces sp. HNM0574]
MRLFAALLPPEDALDELGDAVARLRSLPRAGDLRWTERRNWHLTLAFYPRVTDEQLDELSDRLARAASRATPARLTLTGGGRFADRALWAAVHSAGPEPGRAGVHGAGPEHGDGDAGDADAHTPEQEHRAGGDAPGTEALRRLARACAAAGRRAGIEGAGDGHRFRPHVTLAYTRPRRRDVDLPAYVDALDAFRGTPWTAGELVLVRSHLPVSGVPGEQPRYERLVGWPLGS